MTGVLLMAHGTPASLEDMPEYLRIVRGGRPPSTELIAEMRRNYEAIGGRSPLTELTIAQRDALRRRLGPGVPVAVGMRNWKPFLKEGLEELAAVGVTRVIGLPLAPQFSTLSVTKYFDAAAAVLPAGMAIEPIHSFHDHPLLLDAFAERVRGAAPLEDEEVIFTAHSLPSRVIRMGDRYATEVARTARGVAARAGVRRFRRAYQSAGRTPEPWIGLDLSDLIRHRTARGARRFLVVPVGFVCDHTEILFDVDIQAKATAAECGAALRRTASLNTSPTFIAALESLVRSRLYTGAAALDLTNVGTRRRDP
jgi:protoporphyrin/coproporphyrin ferrochelatase